MHGIYQEIPHNINVLLTSFQGDCEGFCDVLDVYIERTQNIRFGGPTNFAPMIEKAIEFVKETKQVMKVIKKQ